MKLFSFPVLSLFLACMPPCSAQETGIAPNKPAEPLETLVGWVPPGSEADAQDREVLRIARGFLREEFPGVSYEVQPLRTDPMAVGFGPGTDHWNTRFVRHGGSWAALIVDSSEAGASPGPIDLLVVVDKDASRVAASMGVGNELGAELAGSQSPRDIQLRDSNEGGPFVLVSVRYGGAVSTPFLVSLFRLKGEQLRPLLIRENVHEAVLVLDEGGQPQIRGREAHTLCTVCDAWDAAEEQDAFVFPTRWQWNGQRMERHVELGAEEKRALLDRLEARATALVAEAHQSESDQTGETETVALLREQIRARIDPPPASHGSTRPSF